MPIFMLTEALVSQDAPAQRYSKHLRVITPKSRHILSSRSTVKEDFLPDHAEICSPMFWAGVIRKMTNTF